MINSDIQIQLTEAEAMVLFEWLARVDDAKLLPIEHPAEQKALWVLEGKLEKEVRVFAHDYEQLLEEARRQVDASH